MIDGCITYYFEVTKEMSKNTSAVNHGYNSAYKEYSQLQDSYTGNKGYENSLREGAKGAQIQAANASAQQNTSLRNSGQSNAAAAILASNNQANNYNNALAQQQGAAYNAGANAVASQGTKLSAQQTEGQNKYNRAWGNVGATAGIIGSVAGGLSGICDENLKNSVKLTDTDDFFRKHKPCDFKKLRIEIKEKREEK